MTTTAVRGAPGHGVAVAVGTLVTGALALAVLAGCATHRPGITAPGGPSPRVISAETECRETHEAIVDFAYIPTIEGLLSFADLVVLGTVLGSEARIDGQGDIVTVHRLEVLATTQGDVAAGDMLEVREWGGELDGVCSVVYEAEPLRAGETYALLLSDWLDGTVTVNLQGGYRLTETGLVALPGFNPIVDDVIDHLTATLLPLAAPD